ncbi:MAG: exodeoxyribonuclease III [Synechococcaceae cyanobacterium]|nr:exodeoxyribonuclease III [Synechococcaceae cyanobacterium]
MRIATWNVNSVRSRLDQLTAWLAAEQPEVVCLQETKVTDDLFPHDALERLGYSCAVSGQKSYNGVAILSRLPLEDVSVGFDALLPGDPEAAALSEQKRVISARVEGLRILDLYVPNGSSTSSDKYAYKLAWLACLRRYVEAQQAQGDPLVMVGDFNIALEDRDLHDPKGLVGGIMASEPERRALQAVLGERLHDAFRVFEPEAGHWSWWDYRTGAWERDRGWRIDHIYLDGSLLESATGCVIARALRGNPQPSDHAPVLVSLAWEEDDPQTDDDDRWD